MIVLIIPINMVCIVFFSFVIENNFIFKNMNGQHNFLIHLQMIFQLIHQIHQKHLIIFHHQLFIHHQINEYKHRHMLLMILIFNNIHNGCHGMNNLICKFIFRKKSSGVLHILIFLPE
jgi:hypothetical protein